MDSLLQRQVFLFNPAPGPGDEAQMTEYYSPTVTEEFHLNKSLPEWLEEAFPELKQSHVQISESANYHDYRLLSNLRKVSTYQTNETSSTKQKYTLAMEALQKAMLEVHLLSDLTSSLRNHTRYSLKTSFGTHHEINMPSIPITQYVSVTSSLYSTAENRISLGKVELLATLTRQRQFAADLDTIRKHWRISMIDKGNKRIISTVKKLYSTEKDVLVIDCSWRNDFTNSTENSSFTTIVPLASHSATGHVVFSPDFQLLCEKSLTLRLAFHESNENGSFIAVHATSFDPEYQISDTYDESTDLDKVLQLCSLLRHQSKAVDIFQLLNKGLGRVFSYRSSAFSTNDEDSENGVLYPELVPCHVSDTNIAWRVGSSLTLTADLVPVTNSNRSYESIDINDNRRNILSDTFNFLLQQLLLEEEKRKTQATQLDPKMLTVGSAMQVAASTPVQSSAMRVMTGITQVIRSGWHQLIVKTRLIQILNDLRACRLLQKDNNRDVNETMKSEKKNEGFMLKLKFRFLSGSTTSESPWSIHVKYHATALCVVEAKVSALQSSLLIVIRSIDELTKVITEICLQRWLWLWVQLLHQQNRSNGLQVSHKQDGGNAARRGLYSLIIAKNGITAEVMFAAAIVSSDGGKQHEATVHCQYTNITAAQQALLQHVAEATNMQIVNFCQSYELLATTGDSRAMSDNNSSVYFRHTLKR